MKYKFAFNTCNIIFVILFFTLRDYNLVISLVTKIIERRIMLYSNDFYLLKTKISKYNIVIFVSYNPFNSVGKRLQHKR